ncbi:hypothetical protein NBRC113063_00776 [Apilactobacillus micheneri]|nr:hypothetical protein NBRC113063_00776 [Apilactobacillus micheneri]
MVTINLYFNSEIKSVSIFSKVMMKRRDRLKR